MQTPQIPQGHQSEAEMRIKAEDQDSEWPPDRVHMGDMPVQTVMEEYRPSTSPEDQTSDNNPTDNALDKRNSNSRESTMNNNGYQQWGGPGLHGEAAVAAASSSSRVAENYESQGQDLRQERPQGQDSSSAGSDGEYQVVNNMGQQPPQPHAF